MLKTKFEKVKQEKEGIDFKIEKFENASKDLDKLLGSQITDNSKKGLGYNVVPPPHPLIYNRPNKLDLSYSGLEEFQDPEFVGYGVKVDKIVSENSSIEIKKTPDAPIIEEWVSDDEEQDDSPVVVEKKTVVPTIPKVNVVKSKQQEKPVRKPVKYAEYGCTNSGDRQECQQKKEKEEGKERILEKSASKKRKKDQKMNSVWNAGSSQQRNEEKLVLPVTKLKTIVEELIMLVVMSYTGWFFKITAMVEKGLMAAWKVFLLFQLKYHQEELYIHKEEMAPMALSDSEVKTCSKTCLTNYETLKKQYDDLIFKLHETEFKAINYKRGLDTVEAQLVTYRKNELSREKEGIDFKIEKFENASKDLDKLLGSQITDNSKKGLGYNAVPPPHPLIYNRPNKLDRLILVLFFDVTSKFQEPEF
ncbi:hypothetical protein Tco_0994312 [Tanacetum coccineum]